MTHPGKNYPGQKGYPTPNNPPEETVRRIFVVPNSNDWLGLLMGAVETLLDEWRWYDWGDLTPAEAVAAWNDIILAAYESTEGGTVPTPYWDEDSEVDDEAESESQTWYGTVADPTLPPDELTFVENAAIFVFTGFLAAATWEIGAAPAILFHTIAPKFTLAMRRGDVGEIIRILVDGQDSVTVDTSSASVGDVINVPISGDPAVTTGHDIMIVQVS